jgi:ectoine hydroxylase-related dioxygenase (phytanoyl-CoA dioxygenase family)
MNRKPLTAITAAHRETYRRDGVVLVEGAFDPEWIELLQNGWERVRRLSPEETYLLPESFLAQDDALREEIAATRSEHEASRKLYTEQAEGFVRCKYMRWWAPEFRKFALESPAAEIIGRVIGASEVRFFIDAIFMKEANCDARTYWHADQPAWPVTGEMVPTMWMALYPVSAELSSLEYIPGSHGKPDHSWPNTFNAKKIGRPADRSEFFDWETRRSDPDVRFLAFDMQPGDAVILHPAMWHGGGANLHPSQPRVALSTRWFGDDVRWDPHPECINIPGMPMAAMERGQPVTQDDIFPVVWHD